MAISAYGVQRVNRGLDPWEDEDIYSAPISDESEFQEAQQATPTGSAPATSRSMPSLDRVKSANDNLAAHEARRPKLTSYKPNLLQRIGAAAANFGAGYVNAGGRTKVDPRAMQSINMSLLRPGYGDAMRRWEEEGVGAQAEQRAAEQDYKIDAARSKADMDAQRNEAYMSSQRANEALRNRQREQVGRGEWRSNSQGTHEYNTVTGEIRPLGVPPKPTRPMPETPTEAQARREREVASGKYKSLSPEQTDIFIATGKIPQSRQVKAGGSGKGGSGKPRLATPGQFGQVEKSKSSALRAAEKAHLKRMADEVPEADSLRILEQEKAAIMSGYDAGVESLGGSVLPRRQKTETPPTAQKYKESEVRQKAIAAGKDPEYVVNELRKKGLL